MNNLQIAMSKRYGNERNIERIVRIAPDAKITLFNIQKLHPIVSKIRGGIRRILPFNVYKFVSNRLDQLSEKQNLVWINTPARFPNKNNVLLFPQNVESNVAEELIYRLHPCWIHSIMTGIDRLPAIPKTTLVTNSRGIHSVRIAEFVMGSIFALAKNLPEHINQNKKRIWKALPAKMIKGARIGIIGLGSVGIEVAKIAKACGMEVWATKRKVIKLDFVDRLLPSKELPYLLREVDYVVLAVPLTKETRNLIGKAEFDIMKNTASLINICRGEVVNEDELYYALKNNHIRGACIDVFKDEKPLPNNSRFYNLANLMITSYSTYFSDESTEQVMDVFFKNLERFKLGKALLNLADKSQLTHSKQF